MILLVPNVTRNQKVATRRALVAAAAELIDREGLEACSVAAVARAAGVTSGAVYSNFPGVVHLQVEAVTELRARWLPVLDQGRPLPEAVETFVREYAAVWRNPEARTMIIADTVLSAKRLEDPELLALAREGIEGTTERLAVQLAAAAAVGGVRLAVPPRDAALAFQGIVSGLGNVAGVDPTLISTDLVVHTVLAVLIGR